MDIILDYLGGSNITIRVIIRECVGAAGRWEAQRRVREGGMTTEAEVRVVSLLEDNEPRNAGSL